MSELDKKFNHMEKFVNELDELDRCRYLRYIASKILAQPCDIHTPDLIAMGDLCQQTEIVCATLKKIIVETEIDNIVCKKCEKRLPKMRLQEHLMGVNKDCPHDSCEILNEEEFKEESKKSSI
jgi:phage FluMu protein Com